MCAPHPIPPDNVLFLFPVPSVPASEGNGCREQQVPCLAGVPFFPSFGTTLPVLSTCGVRLTVSVLAPCFHRSLYTGELECRAARNDNVAVAPIAATAGCVDNFVDFLFDSATFSAIESYTW